MNTPLTHLTFDLVSVAEILPLRHKILRAGKPFEAAKLPEDILPDTIHFAAKTNPYTVIACLTLTPKPYKKLTNSIQLRGMAVDTAYQSKGVGRMLYNKAEKWLKTQEAQAVWCNARIKAVDFYTSCGFTIESKEFFVPLIGPHYIMVNYFL